MNKNDLNNDSTVQVSNLTVQFDGFRAVDDISFSVKRGEIFGFLGANGAGKTTTIRVLCGLIPPSRGHVSVEGIELTPQDNNHPETDTNALINLKSKVGYMSQKFTLYNDLTVEENLSFAASLRSLNPNDYKKRRDYLLDFISFEQYLNFFVKDLSGGMKQKVSLAASILHDPDIIFLDEPTAGVTPAVRARFWQLIQDLAKQGKTLFVTTHYMDEAENCERIALMRNGKIVALDSPSDLKKKVFPDELYDFRALTRLEYAELQALSKRPEIEYFEPFGLRFHATFKSVKDEEAIKKELGNQFEIKKISPTLEDVFIKIVEGH